MTAHGPLHRQWSESEANVRPKFGTDGIECLNGGLGWLGCGWYRPCSWPALAARITIAYRAERGLLGSLAKMYAVMGTGLLTDYPDIDGSDRVVPAEF